MHRSASAIHSKQIFKNIGCNIKGHSHGFKICLRVSSHDWSSTLPDICAVKRDFNQKNYETYVIVLTETLIEISKCTFLCSHLCTV